MNLNAYFDDLPRPLGDRPEPVFLTMVRFLFTRPHHECPMSEFGRVFPRAKQVLLKPFFNLRTTMRQPLAPTLTRQPLAPTLSELRDLVRAHIDDRVELMCKKGHTMIEKKGVWAAGELSKVVCFSCDCNFLGQHYYSCVNACAFYICASCMVLEKRQHMETDIDESPAKKSKASIVICTLDASG
jgi:hypothetical protein